MYLLWTFCVQCRQDSGQISLRLRTSYIFAHRSYNVGVPAQWGSHNHQWWCHHSETDASRTASSKDACRIIQIAGKRFSTSASMLPEVLVNGYLRYLCSCIGSDFNAIGRGAGQFGLMVDCITSSKSKYCLRGSWVLSDVQSPRMKNSGHTEP